MNKHDWMKSTLSGRRCFICNIFYESDEYGLPKSVFIRFTIPKSMNLYPSIFCVYLFPKLYINTRLICTYTYADEPLFSDFQSLLPLCTKYNALKIKEVFLWKLMGQRWWVMIKSVWSWYADTPKDIKLYIRLREP